MASILDLMGYVQQQGEAGRERGQQNRLASLVGQAYSAPPEQRQQLIGQMAQTSPQAAFDAQKHFAGMDDNSRQKLGQYAAAFDALPDDQKPVAYPQLAQQAQQLGIPAPSEWRTEYAPNISKLAQTLGGGAAGGLRVQSRFVGEDGQVYALMSDSTVKPLGIKADPNMQIIEGADGFYGVDKRGLQARPVQMGPSGPQQPQGGPQPPVVFDADMGEAPKAVQTGLRTWTSNTPDIVGGQAPIPPEAYNDPALRTAPATGGQLRSPGAAPPAGYQWNADRSAMVPIPGGPADKPALTPADVAKEEMAMRKETADNNKQPTIVMDMFRKMEAAGAQPSAPNDLAMIFAYMKMLDPGSVVREQEFANAQNAAGVPDQVRNAWNKMLSGERLNENQRREFLSSARQVASLAQSQITSQIRQQQSTADQYGYDPQRATGAPDFRNITSGGGGTAQQQPGGAARYRVGQVINVGGKQFRVTAIDPNDPSDPDVEAL